MTPGKEGFQVLPNTTIPRPGYFELPTEQQAGEWFHLFIALRPRQWVKNTFVFAAVLYSGNALNPFLLVQTGLVFLVFCLLSSGIYLINDLADIEQDRLHFKKRTRPLASGLISKSNALAAAVLLIGISLSASFQLRFSVGSICTCYILLMTGYSFFFKHPCSWMFCLYPWDLCCESGREL